MTDDQANIHGIGPDTDSGPNPDYQGESTGEIGDAALHLTLLATLGKLSLQNASLDRIADAIAPHRHTRENRYLWETDEGEIDIAALVDAVRNMREVGEENQRLARELELVKLDHQETRGDVAAWQQRCRELETANGEISEQLSAEVDRLTAALEVQKTNRNRDLTTLKHVVQHKKTLREALERAKAALKANEDITGTWELYQHSPEMQAINAALESTK